MDMLKKAMAVLLIVCLLVSGAVISAGAVSFEQEMRNKGFPESYITYLSALHNDHPYWNFEPVLITANNSKYTFDYCVGMEDDGASSLIQTAYTAYHHPTDTQLYDSGWYRASNEAVRYFMDPRNFLNDVDIFMFEALGYNENMHTVDRINETLGNYNFMYKTECDDGLTYAEVISNAGKYYNVSPVFLAGRLKIEQGNAGTSPMTTGTMGSTLYNFYINKPDYTSGGSPVWGTVSKDEVFDTNELLSYDGYYNLFNINASGDGLFAIYLNASKRAVEKGWNTKTKAIFGGAESLASGYLGNNQDTIYFQKFNVVPGSYGNFWYQYMQNIGAPISEGRNARASYKNAGNLEAGHLFKIPVYEGLPETPCADPAGGTSYYSASSSTGPDYGTASYEATCEVVAGQGTVTLNGAQSLTVQGGSTLNISVAPVDGYVLSELKVNTKSLEIINNGGTATYSVIMPPETVIVRARFTASYPMVSAREYRIQCGYYNVMSYAENFKNRLIADGIDAFIIDEGNNKIYIFGGRTFNYEEAVAIEADIKAKGYDCYIRRFEVQTVATNIIMLDSCGAQNTGTGFVYSAFNSLLADIEIPQKNGNKFMGYYTEPNGGGTQYYDENGLCIERYYDDVDTTLYARFDPYYTVNHYIQNIDGKASLKDDLNYSFAETTSGYAKLGVTVSVATSSFANRVAPTGVTVTPSDDGQTVVNCYYRLNYGDVTLDDVIDANDVVAIKQILLLENELADLQKTLTDVNGDGVIDLRDMLRLKLYIANPNTSVGS